MNRIKSLFIVICISTLFSAKGYKTVYLMEFENLKDDFTLKHFENSLPNIIKENYSFRKDINIEYAGDVSPYLDFKENENGLLVNGRFYIKNKYFIIDFEIFDVITWNKLIHKSIYCPYDDMVCIHDSFLEDIETYLSPFLNDQLDEELVIKLNEIGNFEDKKNKQLKKEALKEKPDKSLKKNIFESLDNLAAQASFNLAPDNERTNMGQYGNRYYREFSFGDQDTYSHPIAQKHAKNLLDVMNQFLLNPYDVMIGEIEIKLEPFDYSMVHVSVPVDFTVKNVLVQDLFTHIPHSKSNQDGVILFEFDNADFIFEDEQLIDNLSLMKFQVIPIIYFTDSKGEPQIVLIDSWKSKFDELKLRNIPVLRVENLVSMFAFTPGRDNLQLAVDVTTFSTNYQFTVPRHMLGDYTKMTVKFMDENKIEDFFNDLAINR